MPLTLPKPKLTDDFVVPEPGVYILEFVGYDDPQPSTFNPEKDTIKLKFNVIDDEFGGCQVNEFYGWSTHAKSKLYPVLKALNGGIDIDFDEEDLDLDDFIGKQIMGTIDNTVKPRRDGAPGETVTFAKLVAATPMKRSKPRTIVSDKPYRSAPPPKQATWEDEDEG